MYRVFTSRDGTGNFFSRKVLNIVWDRRCFTTDRAVRMSFETAAFGRVASLLPSECGKLFITLLSENANTGSILVFDIYEIGYLRKLVSWNLHPEGLNYVRHQIFCQLLEWNSSSLQNFSATELLSVCATSFTSIFCLWKFTWVRVILLANRKPTVRTSLIFWVSGFVPYFSQSSSLFNELPNFEWVWDFEWGNLFCCWRGIFSGLLQDFNESRCLPFQFRLSFKSPSATNEENQMYSSKDPESRRSPHDGVATRHSVLSHDFQFSSNGVQPRGLLLRSRLLISEESLGTVRVIISRRWRPSRIRFPRFVIPLRYHPPQVHYQSIHYHLNTQSESKLEQSLENTTWRGTVTDWLPVKNTL